MPWAKLDDGLLTHPKAMAAGIEGRALHIAAILYSSRELTDGVITEGALLALGGLAGVRNAKRTAALLVTVRLFDPHPEGYQVHDYLQYNPSRADVLARRVADSENGKKGARARWGVGQGYSQPYNGGDGQPNGQPVSQTMPPYPVSPSSLTDPTDLPESAPTPRRSRKTKVAIREMAEDELSKLTAEYPDFDVEAELENCRNIPTWEFGYVAEYGALRNRLRLKRADRASKPNGQTLYQQPAMPKPFRLPSVDDLFPPGYFDVEKVTSE